MSAVEIGRDATVHHRLSRRLVAQASASSTFQRRAYSAESHPCAMEQCEQREICLVAPNHRQQGGRTGADVPAKLFLQHLEQIALGQIHLQHGRELVSAAARQCRPQVAYLAVSWRNAPAQSST
jgi:hypothetical protein